MPELQREGGLKTYILVSLVHRRHIKQGMGSDDSQERMKAREKWAQGWAQRGSHIRKVVDEEPAIKFTEMPVGEEKSQRVWHQENPDDVSRRKAWPLMPNAVKRVQ